MFPRASGAGSLQGHWWGFISRNCEVWPIFFLMNVFIALKGTHFIFLFTYFLSEFKRLYLFLKAMKFCAWRCEKEWKVVIARPTGQIENGKHVKYSDKKGIPEFWRIFSCCRCGYIMLVSVYENCRIQSASVWCKNHQDVLNVTKVMTSYMYSQEPRLEILIKFQSRHKGCGFPTLSWLHNDLFLPPDVPSF